MIEGRINSQYEPIITIRVSGPNGTPIEVDAVIDTGFNGFLCLPLEVVESARMPYLYSTTARMADDQDRTMRLHQAEVDWDGSSKTVEAHASGATALVGMQLMTDHQLEMDIRIGGAVRIHSP